MKTQTFAENALRLLAGGLVAGIAGTLALDTVGTVLYESEDKKTRRAEDKARGYHHEYDVAAKKLAHLMQIELTDSQERYWGWKLHRAVGLMGGIVYFTTRKYFPKIGIAGGLGFGTAFFLAADEILVYPLGLTPGPQQFSWKVHARGAAAHICYGVGAELASRAFDKSNKSLRRLTKTGV